MVIRGEGIGRTIGYPTANVDVRPEDTGCPSGVYAARAALRNKQYDAALVIDRGVEVHLLDAPDISCYGEILSVESLSRVSGIEALSGEELVQKIARDIELVRAVLANNHV